MTERIPTFCGKDCGGGACPLLAVAEDGQVRRLEPNPAGARTVKPCPRGYELHRTHYAPDRLLVPLIADGPRGSGRFREAGWDEALGLVARRLGEVRARRGPQSVLSLGSDGSVGVIHNSEKLLRRFLNAIGGATALSSNYSNGAARFVLPYLFGSAAGESGWDAATVRHSRLIILWGANLVEARLGSALGSAVARAARAGVPVIVIDPRRTRTVTTLNARWIPLRPGTDAALMLAVLHVLFRDGLVDTLRTSRLAVGLEDLERYVSGALDGTVRGPAWAQAICGVPAADIEALAREYAAATPAMLIPGYAIQRVLNGEETFRLSVALQIATGNFGLPGGSSGSLNNRLPPPRVGTLTDLDAGATPRVPILRWPDAILEGRSGGYPHDIAAAYVAGFNAVNQGGDTRKAIRALHALDFSVCHELFMTPTARLCDVVLPVASQLEKEDIGLPWLGNYLLYKRAAAAPRGQSRSDFDIFSELSARLGYGTAFSGGKTVSQWVDACLAASEIRDPAAFKASGVYFGADQERVGLARFAADPEGNPLPTPSGKVELRSAAYAADTGRSAIPVWTDPPVEPGYPLLLVTPKTLYRTHSQNGAADPWPDPTGIALPAAPRPDYGALSLNPADAARYGLREGDAVIVYNQRGRVRATASVTPGIMPGVVCLHQGVWVDIGPDGSDRAGSANVLTGTEGSGPAVAPVMHGVAVAIAAGDVFCPDATPSGNP